MYTIENQLFQLDEKLNILQADRMWYSQSLPRLTYEWSLDQTEESQE